MLSPSVSLIQAAEELFATTNQRRPERGARIERKAGPVMKETRVTDALSLLSGTGPAPNNLRRAV